MSRQKPFPASAGRPSSSWLYDVRASLPREMGGLSSESPSAIETALSRYIERLAKVPQQDRDTYLLLTIARLRRGVLWSVQERWDLAYADLSQAVAHDDANIALTARAYRRAVNDALGNYAEAIEDWSMLIAAVSEERVEDTVLASLFVSRANLYLRAERYQDALQDCDTVLSLDPSCADAYAIQGVALAYGRKHYARALKACDAALTGEASAMNYYRRGLVYRLAGQEERAYEDFLRACELEPDNPIFAQEKAHALLYKLARLGVMSAPAIEK